MENSCFLFPFFFAMHEEKTLEILPLVGGSTTRGEVRKYHGKTSNTTITGRGSVFQGEDVVNFDICSVVMIASTHPEQVSISFENQSIRMFQIRELKRCLGCKKGMVLGKDVTKRGMGYLG